MRQQILLSLLLALGCACSAVAAPMPKLKGVPYPQARASLVAAGYVPVKVLSGNDSCEWNNDVCARFNENLNCAGTGLAPCIFLFQDRVSRRYHIVATIGDFERTKAGLNFDRVKVDAVFPADASYLDDLILETREGKRFRPVQIEATSR
jgi:hypothetical protein